MNISQQDIDKEKDKEKDELNNLNIDWIDDYEEEEKQYADFYEEPVTNIKLHFVYVNKNNIIEKIRVENTAVDDDQMVKKERLLYLIKNNMNHDNIQYKLLSLLVYNLDVPSNNLKKYLEEPPESEENYKYLYSLKILEDIKIKETITLFHDINGIYFIFYEKSKNNNSNSNSNSNSHNSTKKIRMHKSKSKSKSRTRSNR